MISDFLQKSRVFTHRFFGRALIYIIPTGGDVVKAADLVMKEALARAGIDFDDLSHIISTGYGRNSVSFSDKSITEISCHAKGANFLFKEASMVIDIGGQDSKAILVGEQGMVKDFVMNDKCAAGTGRFLEVMAGALGLRLEELGDISLRSKKACSISSVCTVFAESEVVSPSGLKRSMWRILLQGSTRR